MSGFSSFIISFCSCCILLGFLYMLCPSGSMEKPIKYIFCLCFVCCVIGSAFALPSPDFSYFDKSNSAVILNEQNTAVTAQTIFAEALRQSNINFRKITVDTNKLNDGSIIISRITVYTTEPVEKVRKAIGSDSYEVVIINE